TPQFVGDKLLALQDDPSLAYALARSYYNQGEYSRAVELLQNYQDLKCIYLQSKCLGKLGRWDDAAAVLGISSATDDDDSVVITLYDAGSQEDRSLIDLARGIVHISQNDFDAAAQTLTRSFTANPCCYDALHLLTQNSLLPYPVLNDLVSSAKLPLTDRADADIIQRIYRTQLYGYDSQHSAQFSQDILVAEQANLANSRSILFAQAQMHFTHNRFLKCIEVCERALKLDKYDFSILPVYLSCLHELNRTAKLFTLAHEYVEPCPNQPESWLAVAVYYLNIKKIPEARRFFSKASVLDPHFGPAWIGFAHTFAVDGEHEQALSAYATAARLFQGSHLPFLFLGMQHTQLNNFLTAEEYMKSAFTLCPNDPLVLNEIGVLHYHKGNYPEALSYLQKAMDVVEKFESDFTASISIKSNLAHVYRNIGKLDESLALFLQVERLVTSNAPLQSAIGLVYLLKRDYLEAIQHFNNALFINPTDAVSNDFMRRALEEN
ncbi:hypothetical protein CANCADRAFT_14857, partial [Tortispora caseinolytica NRRL Y-17796]